MLTKVIVIVAVSLGSVLGLFLMGHCLGKATPENEAANATKEKREA